MKTALEMKSYCLTINDNNKTSINLEFTSM